MAREQIAAARAVSCTSLTTGAEAPQLCRNVSISKIDIDEGS